MSATIAPMAGALDRPGDSMAAQSTKPGAISPMKKSCRASWARRPAKLVMVWRSGMSLTARPDFSRTSSRPAAVVAVASLSSTSMAVGPTSRLPCTVGVTSTPLPYLPGSWNTVCRTCCPAVWSSRK